LSLVALAGAACSGSNSVTTTTAPPNPATAQAGIAGAYQTLFNFSDKHLADKEQAVEDGAALAPGLRLAVSSSLAGSTAGARVNSVTLLFASACRSAKVTAPCAMVKYDILAGSGAAVLPNQNGYASYVGGRWVVARQTICGLLDLFYEAQKLKGPPPGCAS
jgi:hypothetical protein